MPTTATVAELAGRLELDRRVRPYRDRLFTGDEDESLPTLVLDDLSDLPFLVNISGVEEYQHRARVRAGEGDLFAAVTDPVAGYHRYCRDVLGLGSPTFVQADPKGGPLEVSRALHLRGRPHMAESTQEKPSRKAEE